MTLHFLAQGVSFSQLAVTYSVGKSTAVTVVHDTIRILMEHLVLDSIRFPTGQELEQVLVDFESLSGLPQCGGAVDGTFMHIRKPVLFGDSFWCYKQFSAILILACVDARGVFTYVNAGNPGCIGDAAAYNNSRLCRNVRSRRWLGGNGKTLNGVIVQPFLVGDAAFALSTTMLKCFPDGQNGPHQHTLNYRVIRTRRVIEQAFGRWRGRFRVTVKNDISDHQFASDIAMVTFALHNVCERWSCPFDSSWLITAADYGPLGIAGAVLPTNQDNAAGIVLRNHIAHYLHARLPAP